MVQNSFEKTKQWQTMPKHNQHYYKLQPTRTNHHKQPSKAAKRKAEKRAKTVDANTETRDTILSAVNKNPETKQDTFIQS